jgi:hypothetical protein
MAEEPVLKVFHPERLSQQWVLAQIEHAERKIIARAPVGIGLV